MHSEEIRRQIDEEHAEVVAEIEQFAHQLFDPGQREQAADCLRKLVIDIGMHFGFEESLMEEGGYADFDHHRRQHMGIMTELGLLLDRVESGTDLIGTARSVDLLAKWYQGHLAHSDRSLLEWLAARG